MDLLLDIWGRLHAQVSFRGVGFDSVGNFQCLAGISVLPRGKEKASVDQHILIGEKSPFHLSSPVLGFERPVHDSRRSYRCRFNKEERSRSCSVELKMPRFLIGRLVVILLSSLIFYFGIAGLKSGEIRSRGWKFNRDENFLGYWFTVLTSLAGPVAIIYLMLTR